MSLTGGDVEPVEIVGLVEVGFGVDHRLPVWGKLELISVSFGGG